MKPMHRCLMLAVAVGMTLTAAMPVQARGIVYQLPVTDVTAISAEDLTRFFAARKFTLAGVHQSGTVPRFYLSRLPNDLARLPTVARESLFIRLLLPLVAKANADLFAQRKR